MATKTESADEVVHVRPARRRAERLRDGIPLSQVVFQELLALATESAVPFDLTQTVGSEMASTEPLVAALERAPAIVIPLVRQANPAILKRRPAPGEWSIHENACHLAEVHPLFFRRLDLMLSETNPAITSYDPGRDDPDDALLKLDLADSLRRFEEDRARLVARLRQLRLDDWMRTARHDEYNSYSIFTMFRHLALHDFHHAYRIEELLLRKDWPAPSSW